MRAIFRFDASARIGGGHAIRCGTLAAAMKEIGAEVMAAARPETKALRNVPAAPWAAWLELLGPPESEPASIRTQWKGGCDLLVVDHYGWNEKQESALRGFAGRIAVLDDLAEQPHDCDVLLNPGPDFSDSRYEGLVPDAAERVLGPDFALLNSRFARLRPQAIADRLNRKTRCLNVNYGLSDPSNATGVALDAIAATGKTFDVDIAVGSLCPHADEVRRRANAVNAAVIEDAGPDRIADSMAAADLALGAAGTSSWERCCLGLPSVVSVIAHNQSANGRALAERGAAELVPFGKANDPTEVKLGLDRLVENEAGRTAMSAAASRLCDGLGARRAALALLRPVSATDGRTISLRRATEADGEIMLTWQRHPTTRAFSRNPTAPTRAEHFAWLKGRLDDPGCVFNIVLHGNDPAGVLRFEWRGANRYEVSILVAPDRHGCGIGGGALTLGRHLMPWAKFEAFVQDGNEASHALFRRAGYRRERDIYVLPPAAEAE